MTAPILRGSFVPATAPAAHQDLLVLLPSLGTTSALWDGVVAHLRTDPATSALRILRVDLPGHGASPVAHEPFSVADLATSVLRVVDDAGGGSFHVAGVSLGGAVALELAVGHADRVLSLTMSCSGATIGTPDGWAERADAVRSGGTASLVAGSAARWFAPGFLEGDDPAGARALTALLDVDDESYARCTEALGAFDRTASVPGVAVPTLLVSGAHDPVVTSASMQQLAETFPDAAHTTIASAGHLAVLESPALVAGLLRDHLVGGDAHARGMRVRREVLGDAHVDAAIAATTAQTAPFQDFLTRYAWGEVWARPGLSRRDRSIATLASLVTGGHHAELTMHVRAALRNGLSPDEISEVVLHTALYAGLPAANAAMAVARGVFAETEEGEGHGQDRRDG